MSDVEPRKGMPSPRLSESEFRRRYLEQFVDPAFDSLSLELDRIAAAAWDAYAHSRKAPRTRKAGSDFADPDYDLSADWLAARERIRAAQRRQLRATQDARRRMVNQVGRPGMNGSGSQEPGIHPGPLSIRWWQSIEERSIGARAPRELQQTGPHETDDEGQGRQASKPSDIPPRGWKDILWRVYENINEHGVMAVAAGVTFYVLLALFPGVAALVSLYGLFADPTAIGQHLSDLSGFIPERAIQVIGDQLKNLTSKPP